MEIFVPFAVIAIGLGAAIVSSIRGIRNRWQHAGRDFAGGYGADLTGNFGSDFGGGDGGGGGGGCGGGT